MITETGTADTLAEVGTKFLTFVQLSNDSTVAWEVMPFAYSKLSSFFGKTIRVSSTNDDADFYITLQHTKVDSSTYSAWLRNTKDNYMSESFDNRTTAYIGRDSDDTENYELVRSLTKYGSDNSENIFKNTGEMLAVNVHTLYDPNLWMCEQGGGCCSKEYETQTIANNMLRARRIKQPKHGTPYEAGYMDLPSFPGMGCPTLTVADVDREEIRGKLNYYFIRDNQSANIVIYLQGGEDGILSYNKPLDNVLVQHISFGRMNTFSADAKFKFPLYVAGGNEALCQDIWIYTPLYNPYNTYITGNSIDLSMHNTCLSNSTLLLSTKFNGSDISNFRVMSASGEWKNVFNCVQTASVKNPHLEYGQIQSTWYYTLNAPDFNISQNSTTTNNINNTVSKIDTYAITSKITDYGRVVPAGNVQEMRSSTLLDPISVILLGDYGSYGVSGQIPNCYSVWSRNIPFGELTIGSKKFLCIPNAWDMRLWNYPDNIGVVAENENNYLRDKYEKFYNETYNNMYNYMIHDRLLIYIGKAESPLL